MIKIGNDINLAKKILDKNGLVAIPTETVYGLAGNATNKEAVNKIYLIKKRPFEDPLICHTNSLEKILNYTKNIPETAIKLADYFWPGPMTLIFEKKNIIPDITTSNLSTVGFRIPNNSITLELLHQLDYPLAAPSANIFGYISPTETKHITQNFKSGIDYILDGGKCNLGIESTIIGFHNNIPVIHRLGSLIIEDIKKKVGEVEIVSSDSKFPGSFKNHYTPNKDLFLGDVEKLFEKYKNKKIGILCFDKYYDFVDKKNQIILSKKSSLIEASKNLYSSLYKLDNMKNVDVILSSLLEENMIGRSINNRLIKSSIKND